jgi:hypothetical protein
MKGTLVSMKKLSLTKVQCAGVRARRVMIAACPCVAGDGTAIDAGTSADAMAIDAAGDEKMIDAPQLTKIAPEILHSKGCLEAV